MTGTEPLCARRAGQRAFSRAASVTQRHTSDEPDLERPLFRPVALVCRRPVIASRGPCRGSIQRRYGHIMVEQALGLQHVGKLARSPSSAYSA